jgi:copper(I)-binding protein
MPRSTALPAALLASALVLGAAACGSPNAPTGGATPLGGAASTTAPAGASPALTLADGWAKAGTGMTGAFGTLTNTTDAPITITTAASDAADRTELHTMAKQDDGTMKMVQKEGGLVVPAKGTVALAPGGEHVMLIGLRKELRNGDQVRITLTSSTGESYDWTVAVRSFAGAEEEYLPGATSTSMGH